MKEQVIKIMQEVFQTEIDYTTTQADVANWDSLRHLNLMIALEMAFNVEIDPEQMGQMVSVDQIIAVLSTK